MMAAPSWRFSSSRSVHPRLGLVLLLIFAVQQSSAWAQDHQALTAALRNLEPVLLVGSPRLDALNLSGISDAYSSIDDKENTRRTLLASEPLFIEYSAGLGQDARRGSLDMLLYRYRKLGDYLSIERLAQHDPDTFWARLSKLRNGDQEALSYVLKRPLELLQPDSVADAFAAYIIGAAEREGTLAAIDAAEHIRETADGLLIQEAIAAPVAYFPNRILLGRGWTSSVAKWLPGLLFKAHAEKRKTEVLDWIARSTFIDRSVVDQSVVDLVLEREKEGDEAVFEAYRGSISDGRLRATLTGTAAIWRLVHGRIASGTDLAKQFLLSSDVVEAGRANVPRELRLCENFRRTGVTLDRDHRFTAGGMDCDYSFANTIIPTLGLQLVKTGQVDLARALLDLSFVAGTWPESKRKALPRDAKPCSGNYMSSALAKAYYDAGAKGIVREYAEYLAYECPISHDNGFLVGRFIALLNSPAAVTKLLRLPNFLDAETAEEVLFGFAGGLSELGAADELAKLLPMSKEPGVALHVIHRHLPDLGTGEGRAKAEGVLRVTLPYLQREYLTVDDPEWLSDTRTTQWMINYARAGMFDEIAPIVAALESKFIDRLNAIDLEQQSSSSDVGKGVLALGRLFLAALIAGRSSDAARIASRLRDDEVRSYFLASAAEAFALCGQVAAASETARQVAEFPGKSRILLLGGGKYFAGQAIGEAIARDGDLTTAYRVVISHRQFADIPKLFQAYREGLSDPKTRLRR